MATIDLSLLAAPEVIDALDFETILAELKADLVARFPDCEPLVALESEPLVKLLEVAAYRELHLRARYNDDARALLLAFASGATLDHIGATYYREVRLQVSSGDLTAVPPAPPTYESDAAYVQRLALKPESYSVAGPTDAYRFHALSASAEVKDVGVTSPQPGTTAITVLSTIGNGVPTQALLDAVALRLNDKTVRPFDEEVLVEAGTVINYSLDVDLYTYAGPDTSLVLAQADAALAEYTVVNHRLGNDITLSGLYAAAHRPGVQRAVINNLNADIQCAANQAAYCTGITVRIAGVAQ